MWAIPHTLIQIHTPIKGCLVLQLTSDATCKSLLSFRIQHVHWVHLCNEQFSRTKHSQDLLEKCLTRRLLLLPPCSPFIAPNTLRTLMYWNQNYSNRCILTVPMFWGIHHVPVTLAWWFQASRSTKHIFSKADTQKKEIPPGPELCWTEGTGQDLQRSSGHWTHKSIKNQLSDFTFVKNTSCNYSRNTSVNTFGCHGSGL